MNFMASWRSALIIVAGLWLCLAGPVSAQESDAGAASATSSDTTVNTESTADAPTVPNKPVKLHVKKPSAAQTHQSSKVASKLINGRRTDDALASSPDDGSSSSIPATVSNAKAQLGAAGGSVTDNALKAMSEQADDTLKSVNPSDPATSPAAPSTANGGVVASNQLNDVDRSLSQDTAPAPTLSMMVPQTPTYTMSTTSNVDSTWGRTSLIGKVFVALGGLLTLASAARMFIA
jgi:hypothetical protein